ncbi:MFS transporter [Actinosynnema pretiosum]|uniref:MFS transporter n=1 Tax=Actinosynnema pretiosum TaxID=42197 RepID=A0A290YZ76_9PSEU|nr:MFS transporter [Actinosynnema pretiosum]ATE52043.1 MFS transporter [Actinosynnema pretiosum]
MSLNAYRSVLRTPQVVPTMLVVLLARIPITGVGMTLTMHVLLALDHGYAAAGLVGMSATAGSAIGSPLLGRMLDRRGLRAVVGVSIVVEALFWLTAPLLSYPVLLVTAFLSSLAALPVMSLGRQALTALVPESGRRTALALDSMAVELAFMAGPALGVFLGTHFTGRPAMWVIGTAVVLSGLLLWVVDPPLRAGGAAPGGQAPRGWLDRRLLGVLISAGGATFLLTGVELATVAQLRAQGLTGWTGAAIVVMCAASLVGGFWYGGFERPVPVWALMAGMGVLTLPLVVAGGSPWLLGAALALSSFLCAPTLTATGEAITTMAPEGARGTALGLQGTAFTLGSALGQPVVGWTIDHVGPSTGFAVAALGSLAIAGLVVLLGVRGRTPEPVAAG